MSSPEESARQSPRRKKKKKRLVKKQKPIDIISRTPGVHKMVLSELAQNIIGCIAGENITAENPWMYVKKELVQDNIELHEESSEFLPIKKFILEFPRSQLLIGYIPDETRDVDEFFICVTEEATDIVTEIIEKMKQDQEERLHNAITKEVHRWVSQGTEEQINESMIRNNRPLLEVEVETKYPIFPGKIQFRLVKAEDRKDGYMELVCERDKQPQNVVRTRIDGWAQVAPAFVSREAQTTCTYPINSSTQYLYEVEDCADWYTKNEQGIVTYTNDHMEDFSDLLKVNGAINLYANDFASLVHDVSTTVVRTVAAEFEEYMSLMDVFMCKDKMVSDICWHRMWSGTVAVCYADNAQNTFLSGPNKEDEVLRSVHGMNPMLLWSFMDGLKPKLILESPREVQVVSFCKFDENVLVGGCKNGQIVIWDLRNKLEKVEEVEILTSNQQKYRSYMFSLMGWMKNIFNLSIVRATAVSNLKYSHKGPVTDITWLDPHYEISKIGNLTEFPEHSDELSMQLMTSSEDGTLLVWDLLKTPTVTTGGVRIKKLKRLKRKPSALETQISPFKILNHNIKPLYKINVLKPNSKKHLPVSKFCSNYCHILYDAPITDKNKKFNLADRIMRQPRLDVRNKKGILPELFIGTMEGDFAKLKWDGQDFDSGEVVNSEVGQYIYFAKYHDAPIVTTVTAITHKCTLTVGGKVFALWRDDFPGRPVLWRRCKHLFTKAEWSIFQPYKFIVYSLDGVIQKWLLPVNSKEPISSHFMSSSYVTTCGMHPFKQQKNVYGIGDKQGVFRLFYSPPQATESNSTLSSMMDHFINREIKRKKNFLDWQEQWQKRHEVYIKEKRLESEAQIAEDKRREEAEAEKEDDKKDAAVRKGPQPGKYIEWVIEQRQKAEEARVRSIIINKKQLDTKELERRRKPLQKLEEENERKKKKQKQRLKEGENIFHETVATLFPDVVKEKPIPPPDPYSGGDAVDELNHCFREFEHLKYDSEEYIEDNPYLFEFDWKKTLMGGRKARQFLDDVCFVNLHWKRYDQEKQERKRMMGIVDEEELRTEDLEGVSERQSEMDDVDDENNAERSQSKSRHRSTVQFED